MLYFMTKFRYFSRFFLVILLTVSLIQCKKNNNNNNLQTIKSQICDQVTGMEAIYWDIMNGVPRGDIPGGIPTIKSLGGTYINPYHPLLGFPYPSGYQPFTDNTQGAIGVNLIRQDNQAIWRYTLISISGTASAQQVVNNEISNLQQFMGTNATVQTVCANQSSNVPGSGILQNSVSRFIRFGNFSATVNVSVTSTSGISQLAIAVSSSPTNQFPGEIQNTFLPIAWELLFTNGTTKDTDGDGYPDSIDKFPLDPSKH